MEYYRYVILLFECMPSLVYKVYSNNKSLYEEHTVLYIS